jgi:hypothetical protein
MAHLRRADLVALVVLTHHWHALPLAAHHMALWW